jgi:hypothetical protein
LTAVNITIHPAEETKMCVFMVRSRVTTEGGSEVEAALEKAFPAIAKAQPLERDVLLEAD